MTGLPMFRPFRVLMASVFLAALPLAALAGGTNVSFGGLKGDPTQPVEVTAESLSVDQATGAASFEGGVKVVQGAMVLTADQVTVTYGADQKKIASLRATGHVVLQNGTESASAQRADYTIDTGVVVLTGAVQLSQGQATITGATLTVNLTTGTGRMDGGVTTTFVPAGNN